LRLLHVVKQVVIHGVALGAKDLNMKLATSQPQMWRTFSWTPCLWVWKPGFLSHIMALDRGLNIKKRSDSLQSPQNWSMAGKQLVCQRIAYESGETLSPFCEFA